MKCSYCSTLLTKKWENDIFMQCPNCSLLIRNQLYETKDLDQLYENSWNNPNEEISETGGTTPKLARSYSSFLLNFLMLKDFRGKKILDYGAGRGDMTMALLNEGADVYAIEPYGYSFLKEKNVKVYQDITEIPDNIQFDGVVSLDVVEHLTRPWEDLKAIYQFLVPGGWIFVSTPNANSLNARVNGSKWREAHRRGHLFLFNSFSLGKMIRESGYKKVNRLFWNVTYDQNPIIKIKDWILLLFRLDGELRFIGFKE